MLVPILISVIVFIAVILITLAIYYYWQRKEDLKQQSQRIEQAITVQTQASVEQGPTAGTDEDSEKRGLRRDTRISSIPWLNEFLGKHLKDKSKSIMILIEQSGLKIKVSEYVLVSVLVAFTGSLGLDIITHKLLISFAGFALGILPYFILHFLKGRRVAAFVNQLPQGLDLLSSDLRAGLDVQAGIKHLSEEFPPPLSEEFAKVVIEINLGLSLSEALNNLSKRINTMDVQILCTGIIINRELGGNLSELIGSIAETVRERFRLKGMIKALTAESQMSAMLLIFLPIGLYILLNVMAPATYNPFIKDPIGQNILIGCVVSMGIGYLMMQKITKIEV